MNRAELCAAIATDEGVTQGPLMVNAVSIDRILDAFERQVIAALTRGDEMKLKNFGRFDAIAIAAHPGRNPRTGEAITTSAHQKIRFHPGKRLRDALVLPERGK